jgi:hypothetical protein
MLITRPANAQADATVVKKFFVKFTPQHLFINGLHMELEKPLQAGTRASVIVSPRVYSGQTRTVDALASRRYAVRKDETRVNGVGLEVQHRVYLSSNANFDEKRFYFAYGPNFHRFNVKFRKEGYQAEVGSDGLTYYRGTRRPFNEKIYRWGAVAMLGLQQPMYTARLLIDLYLGPGYKYSTIRTNYTSVRYNERTSDFGYTGFYLLTGIKFGVAF